GMCEGGLRNVVLKSRPVAAPILKGRSEAVDSHVSVPHSIESHKHCHVAQMLVRVRRARKQIALTGRVQELHCTRAKGNHMLPLELHALCGHCPEPLLCGDFAWSSQSYFLGASSRQNGKLERTRCDTVVRS